MANKKDGRPTHIKDGKSKQLTVVISESTHKALTRAMPEILENEFLNKSHFIEACILVGIGKYSKD